MSNSSYRAVEFPPIRPPLVMMDKTLKWKPNKIEIAPNCPRCSSSNTKFCYYNNYSVSQPRYFCKSCRRYWTKGGSLRNVPIGGGCRKSRRCSASRQDCSPLSSESGGATVLATLGGQNNVEKYEASGFVASDQFLPVGESCSDGHDFVYQDFDAFKDHQMLWSEGQSDHLQRFGCDDHEPLMEEQLLQEFEGFDQRMSENLVTDNWASFDLSGYEDF